MSLIARTSPLLYNLVNYYFHTRHHDQFRALAILRKLSHRRHFHLSPSHHSLITIISRISQFFIIAEVSSGVNPMGGNEREKIKS